MSPEEIAAYKNKKAEKRLESLNQKQGGSTLHAVLNRDVPFIVLWLMVVMVFPCDWHCCLFASVRLLCFVSFATSLVPTGFYLPLEEPGTF